MPSGQGSPSYFFSMAQSQIRPYYRRKNDKICKFHNNSEHTKHNQVPIDNNVLQKLVLNLQPFTTLESNELSPKHQTCN